MIKEITLIPHDKGPKVHIIPFSYNPILVPDGNPFAVTEGSDPAPDKFSFSGIFKVGGLRGRGLNICSVFKKGKKCKLTYRYGKNYRNYKTNRRR